MKMIILLFAVFLLYVQFTYVQFDNLDTSFGDDGIVRTDIGQNYNYSSFGEQVLVQPDGSIYLILRTNYDQYFIAKRNPNGSLDSSYGYYGSSVSVRMQEARPLLPGIILMEARIKAFQEMEYHLLNSLLITIIRFIY